MHPDQDQSQEVRCVITRLGLRGSRFLLPTYRDYRRLAEQAAEKRPSGLLRNAFLVENPSTCYSLSLWTGQPLFSAQVPDHIDVVRRVFGRLALDEERGPELWSTTWRLEHAGNNVKWGDLQMALPAVHAGEDSRAA